MNVKNFEIFINGEIIETTNVEKVYLYMKKNGLKRIKSEVDFYGKDNMGRPTIVRTGNFTYSIDEVSDLVKMRG